MRAENLNQIRLFGLSFDKDRFQAAKLGVGIAIFLSGFYLMSKNQDIPGIMLVAIGMFVILI